MKRSTSSIIVAAALIIVVGLFAFFLKDILIPYVKLELANDLEGAKELLLSKGILGLLTVVLVEGLEMVVVFISAEFIQISAGMSYPFYIAIPLCDMGVCLGATIIFVLVRAFKFTNRTFEKNEEKIVRIASASKKERSTVLLMYLLFIMPLIPFGAICYYGSRSNVKYGKYILTVATGVIPSIVTSIFMGTAAKFFLGRDLPLPLLILIIVALGAVLFVILAIFLDKVYFKENDKTPDSVIYSATFRLADLLWKHKRKLHIDDTGLRELKPPYIVLSGHPSFYDFHYVHDLVKTNNPALVVNRHLISAPVIRTLGKKGGFIPKKLFNPDFTVPRSIMKAIKNGYSVVIFPEARLSLSGREYPVIENGGALYKKLGVDIVIVRLRGAYLVKPKWRKRTFRNNVYAEVARIITKEELASLGPSEIDDIINENISRDDSEIVCDTYRQKDKAKGLENVLYRCIDCGELYSTSGKGNEFICTACGSRRHINESYHFDEEPYTINACYERIKELERKELASPDFKLGEIAVKTVLFSEKGRYKTKSSGWCTLTREGLSYRSQTESFTIGADSLPALPFSCGEEFEVYHDDKLYYFYPEENRRQVTRWALFVDLMEEEKREKK